MPLSDRELNNVISFYMGLRKAVFIVGVAVVLAAIVAGIAFVYNVGLKDGAHGAAALSSPQTQTAPTPQEDIDAPDLEESEEGAAPQ